MYNVDEKKERVKIRVMVDIEYDGNDPESRENAINMAIENVMAVKNFGYPITVIPVSAKEVKR